MMYQLTRLFVWLFFNKREKKIARALNYKRLLVLNFIVQRAFGSSDVIPYSVHHTSRVSDYKNGLQIENDSLPALTSLAISGGCYFSIHEGTTLSIGENTIWAPQVSIVTGNHGLLDRNAYTKGNVVIGKNCWLAKGVSVMPGVVLGDNVTVGANSVVTKSFPSNVVIAGVPAKIIRHLEAGQDATSEIYQNNEA